MEPIEIFASYRIIAQDGELKAKFKPAAYKEIKGTSEVLCEEAIQERIALFNKQGYAEPMLELGLQALRIEKARICKP